MRGKVKKTSKGYSILVFGVPVVIPADTEYVEESRDELTACIHLRSGSTEINICVPLEVLEQQQYRYGTSTDTTDAGTMVGTSQEALEYFGRLLALDVSHEDFERVTRGHGDETFAMVFFKHNVIRRYFMKPAP